MKKLRTIFLVLACTLLTSGCMFAQSYKIHVKPAPLQFSGGTTDISINAGQGYVIGIPFNGGVGPFTCTADSTAPSYVVVTLLAPADGTTDGNCVVTANSTPDAVPGTDIVFNAVVTDSKGTTAKDQITITSN